MFTSPRQLVRRSGPYGIGRLAYLQDLVNEFHQAGQSLDYRLQLAANLASFAYDPVNFDFLRHLGVVPGLLMECASSEVPAMRRLGLAGISNCCPDPANARLLLSAGLVDCLRRRLLDATEAPETLGICLAVLAQLAQAGGPATHAAATAVATDPELRDRLRQIASQLRSDDMSGDGENDEACRIRAMSNLARVACIELGVD